MGYSFEPKGLSIAPKTLANFLERKTQLYEQDATVRRIGQYVRNWWRWVRAGVETRHVSMMHALATYAPTVNAPHPNKDKGPGANQGIVLLRRSQKTAI